MGECSTSVLSPSEPDLAARMAAHERLVVWVVRRQWLGPLGFEEALQAGRIGLWQALRHFDPDYSTQFSTYAVKVIARHIWREVARATRAQRVADRLAHAEGEGADPGEPLLPAPVAEELGALVATLPARLRAVVVAHHGLDGTAPQTFAALGRAWGISRQRVHQLHVRALLLLAQPAISSALRTVLGRQRRCDYQRTLARQRQVARAARRGRR